MKVNRRKTWESYKLFCLENGLKENNFKNMKLWVEIGMNY